LEDVELLNEKERKEHLEKAIYDIASRISNIRATYMRVQQGYLAIGDQSVDGRPIQEADYELFELNKDAIEKKARLVNVGEVRLRRQ